MATVYYKRNSGTNWNANASWTTDNDVTSATNTGTYPEATDTANFKLNSSDCTINATSACAIVDCTGYTGTLTQSAKMTTTGNVTFSSGMTFTPNTQYWVQTGSAIITTNGKHFYNFQPNISGGGTITLADDLHGTGLLYIHDNTTFAGSGNIFWSGSFAVNYANICAGRTITFDGTGSLLGSVGQINSNIIINTSGTITFGSASINSFLYGGDGTGTFTYTAGTIAYYDASTGFVMGWGTYSVNGMTIQNAYLHIPSGASPFTSTLTSDAQFNGFTRDWHNNVLACGSHAVTITGDLDNSGSDATPFTGTGTFIFNGTTTLKSNSITFPGNFTINAGKTVTFSASKNYIITGNLTLNAGSTLTLGAGGTTVVSGTFSANGTSGSHVTFNTTTPSSVAYFNSVTLGTITYVDATDIDSSAGLNKVPLMTSNTAPSGVASADSSTYPDANSAFRVFNGAYAAYLTDCWYTNSGGGSNHWIQYQFTSAQIINCYVVGGTTTNDTTANRKPKNWTLVASNTGAFGGEETTLDTRTN